LTCRPIRTLTAHQGSLWISPIHLPSPPVVPVPQVSGRPRTSLLSSYPDSDHAQSDHSTPHCIGATQQAQRTKNPDCRRWPR
jgi:hypothetical protein